MPSCRRLFASCVARARSWTPLKAGMAMPASTAMIVMTMSNSMRVKPARKFLINEILMKPARVGSSVSTRKRKRLPLEVDLTTTGESLSK